MGGGQFRLGRDRLARPPYIPGDLLGNFVPESLVKGQAQIAVVHGAFQL